jgi:hypothetical protein
LNKGLSKCSGEIFNWINSDDYLEEKALFKIADCFMKNPSADVICGWCRLFDQTTLNEVFRHRTEIFETLEETLLEQRINQPSTFYKLKVVRDLGGINSDLQYVMDLDLWFRYLTAHGQSGILTTDELFAHFRLHSLSKTVQLQDRFRQEEKSIWYHLLSHLRIKNELLFFFQASIKYNKSIQWNFIAINRQRLINSLCKTYLFPFYKAKNFAAARYAFQNQLKLGNLRFQKNYVGLFYNLFLRWR